MNIPEEFLNAIEILIDKRMQNTAQIYTGRVIGFSGSKCVVNINGRNQIVQFYGSAPTVNSMYRVFVPQNNMSMAFIITGGDGSSPTPTPETTDYNALKNLPSINNITLSRNKNSGQLNLYGNDNPPPYPVTSVNGQTDAVVLDANDIGAYTKEEISSLLLKKPNPNLLDNWYFGNPVNQRGLKTYANSSGFYGIDRWRIASGLSNSCYVEINDGYVSFVNANITPGSYIYFEQNFEYDITPTGVPRTVSIMDKDGILRSYTGQNDTSWEYDNGIYVYQASQKSLNFRLDAGKRLDMKVVKFELGSQQTLAHQDESGNWVLNEIPDYGEQLARCQRYFIPDQQRDCYGRYSGNSFYVVCPTPVSLRTMPTISISAMGQVVDRNGIGHSVNGISPVVLGDSSVLLVVTIVGTSVSGPAVLMDAHFSLSADL